jgi:hypothetical protein
MFRLSPPAEAAMTPMTASVMAATDGGTFIATVFLAGGLVQRLAHRASVMLFQLARVLKEIILAYAVAFVYGSWNKGRTFSHAKALACLSAPPSRPLSWTRSSAPLLCFFWRPPAET